MKHYVYSLINPIDNKTIYIGKGSARRMYDHLKNTLTYIKKNNNKTRRGCNHKLLNKIASILNQGFKDVLYETLLETDDENEAYLFEEKIINEIGLENLCNLTPGGKGGRKGYKHTEENRLKAAKRLEEAKPALIAALKGKTLDRNSERYKKQVESIKNATTYKTPESEEKRVKTFIANRQFKIENGLPLPQHGQPKGHTKSEEHKKNLSIAATKRMEDPEQRRIISKKVTQTLIGNTRSGKKITLECNGEIMFFESILDISRHFNISKSAAHTLIKNAIKGKESIKRRENTHAPTIKRSSIE